MVVTDGEDGAKGFIGHNGKGGEGREEKSLIGSSDMLLCMRKKGKGLLRVNPESRKEDGFRGDLSRL